MLAKYWQTFLALGALLLAILALAYARLSIKSSAEDFERQLQIAIDSYRIEKESIVIAYEREKRANAEAKAKYDSDLASIKEKYEGDIARLDEETKKRFDDIVKSSKGDPKKLAELMKKEFGFEVVQ